MIAALSELQRGFRNTPSEAHMGRSPFECVFGVPGEPLDRLSSLESVLTERDLPTMLAGRLEAKEALQNWLLRQRIDRQVRRERGTGPTATFAVGDTVMLIRPPADKMTQGAVGPYLVVTADESQAYYSIAIMGADGNASGIPTRAAALAGQLRPFDMSRTTPQAEGLRLHRQEFGDDTCPIRSITGHRPSERSDAHVGDLEFHVVWITEEGDVPQWEPVSNLTRVQVFKDYVLAQGLSGLVKKQASRERRRT